MRILEGLARRGIVVDAVVVESPFAGTAPRSVLRTGRRSLRLLRTRRLLPRLARVVVPTGRLNSESMRADLAALAPDFLVLGGIGIVSEAILDTAKTGVLNAHPALLPWVRGNGVVGRSLERGVPVGSTVHYATRKVDAGPVIDRRLVQVANGVSLRELEARADELAAEMMVDVVEDAAATGTPPEAVAQQETFPVSRRLSLTERRGLDRAARAGRAAELFGSWKAGAVDGSKYRLQVSFEGVYVKG